MSLAFRKSLLMFTLATGSLMSIHSQAWADITVGAILPLTGTSADIGDDQRRGIELAVEDINAHGGVAGQPLHVMIEDSAGSPTTALDAVRKLTEVNKVPLVIGEFSSSVTIPIGQFLVKNHITHINIAGSSTAVRKIGNSSFSVIGLDDLSAKFTAEDVYNQGYRNVAFIAPNGAYGQGMAEQFAKYFTAKGGKVAGKLLYTEGQSSYRRELQQLAHSNPDLYVYTSYGQEAVVLNRESYELGLSKTPWYGMYLTMATAGSDAQVVSGQKGMEVAGLGDKGQGYLTAYQQKYHQKPKSTYSSYAYDATELAAAAINKAGNGDSSAILNAMYQVAPSFAGVTGALALDSDRQRQQQPYEKVQSVKGAVVPR
jgi:branched-chain amino acid transport system substrate-binding protein